MEAYLHYITSKHSTKFSQIKKNFDRASQFILESNFDMYIHTMNTDHCGAVVCMVSVLLCKGLLVRSRSSLVGLLWLKISFHSVSWPILSVAVTQLIRPSVHGFDKKLSDCGPFW